MDENANLDKNSDPDMEVFIFHFENLDIMDDYDIYDDYTSKTYRNVDVSLNLSLTTCQSHSNPQQAQFEPIDEPEQQHNEHDEQHSEQPEA